MTEQAFSKTDEWKLENFAAENQLFSFKNNDIEVSSESKQNVQSLERTDYKNPPTPQKNSL